MSPNDVLLAATATNAAILRRGHDLGEIAEGYLADCIAVLGNPAEDVAMLQNIRFVMKNGAVIAR
jgi:imidazolonepropionase-like amidohydrolase